MKVVLLVPRRAGVADRDRLWAFTQQWWRGEFPDWPIIEGHHDVGPFNRSAAINEAARLAGDFDVAVVIDADVLCDPRAVRAAAMTAAALPVVVCAGHRQVHVNAKGTERVLNGYRGNWEPFADHVYTEHWSSCVAVGRPLWELVGGFDDRFVGWGHEDDAFRFACETMGGHPMMKMTATIWHLWHAKATVTAVNRNANRARAELYRKALNQPARMIELLDRDQPPPTAELVSSRIPRIIHRTIPADGASGEAETFWQSWRDLHPGWTLRTWQDPLDPADFPLTGHLFDRVKGAQLAGLVRLEVLWHHGGVYVDSDVEPYRTLEPLVHARGFAGWEDRNVVPDAVLGAEPHHPALEAMLDLAVESVLTGGDPWESGPGVTTSVLPYRDDWLLLPPGSFYPYHYTQRARRDVDHSTEQPWAFAAHHWAGSWLTAEQQHQLDRAQRRSSRVRA